MKVVLRLTCVFLFAFSVVSEDSLVIERARIRSDCLEGQAELERQFLLLENRQRMVWQESTEGCSRRQLGEMRVELRQISDELIQYEANARARWLFCAGGRL